MTGVLKKILRRALKRFGYRLTAVGPTGPPQRQPYPDIEYEFLEGIYRKCAGYTLTPPERAYALYRAVHYVVRSGIAGDFVECGVWRGGSAMLAAWTLLELGDTSRDLYLYDTFAGMSEPSTRDVDHRGRDALPIWRRTAGETANEWCYASFEEVVENLRSTGYPMSKVHFVRGRVEETIPKTVPPAIAILRLDTDWYESTYHELLHLYPALTRHGVLIVDDYGYWKGAREATDQYFDEHGDILLQRVDSTCRVGIKTD